MDEKNVDLQLQRLDLFVRRLGPLIHRDAVPLRAMFRKVSGSESFADARRGRFRPAVEGQRWGKTWDRAWFRLDGRVPSRWRGKHVAALLCFNGEGLVYDRAGTPLQGITNGSVFDHHFSRNVVSLFPRARGGETVALWVEAVCNGLSGVTLPLDPEVGQTDRYGYYEGRVNSMRLAVEDDALWHLRLDVMTLAGLLKSLPRSESRHARILEAVVQAMNAFGDDPSRAASARALLAPALACRANASALQVTAVGHAHIDTGWLWPVEETIRKCARTYASQIRLLERYPAYVFGASQPQHYAFIREHHPELYRAIRRAIRRGRWECQGGMWVEADCNLIGGESMIRQFLHGKNFFRDEFGVDVRHLWLPDVFGYSGAMPQILQKVGCSSFVTQKLSWSKVNRFPHHTFRWRGIDGSEVLTHFPPEDTCNSTLLPDALRHGAGQFKERGFADGFMVLFGVGDGGGGPHEEHIELGLRQQNLEGSPRVRFATAQSFLDGLTAFRERLPVWDGELYLETHRGTLTSQAAVKQANRRVEARLRQMEYLWACLPLRGYPVALLDSLWKRVLLNQFHDILPGSSITRVYQDAMQDYALVNRECDALEKRAAMSLFERAPNRLTLVNCLSSPVSHPIPLPSGWQDATIEDGRPIPVQVEPGGAVAAVTVPVQGTLTLRRRGRGKASSAGPVRRSRVLENELLRAAFAPDGTLERLFDKECGRDVLAPHTVGNRLCLFVDRPNEYDAWDVDFFYEQQLLETARGLRWTRLPGGPVRETLVFELAIGRSRIKQTVYLAAGSKRLTFETEVDWREKHRMLRVRFPVAVSARMFSSDIQYGYIERPTHRNTSWDQARFEVAAHRYVDLSDRDYGVALLNDCKYGHAVHEQTMDLNLLRSPTYPDPDADQGCHGFTYALLPHAGPLVGSPVMAEAAALNVPLLRFENVRGTLTPPLRVDDPDGVSLEALKCAEKERTLILRLVETQGRHAVCRLAPSRKGMRLTETNLMEWTEDGDIPPEADGSVRLAFKPFEIRTFKWRRAPRRQSSAASIR